MALPTVSKRQLVLADKSFSSKTEAKRYFRAMLHRYRPGERVDDVDAKRLSALLSLHPEAEHKIGVGIDCFDVRRNMGTNGFWIVRVDGTETDFSYLRCLDGAPSAKRTVSDALRYLVSDDVRSERDTLFAGQPLAPCAVTGKMLTAAEGHMDHQPPMLFDVIVAQFLVDEGLTYETVGIGTGADAQMVPKLLDGALAERFRAYHRRVAKLAFVEASVNLSMGARPRIKQEKVPPS